MSDIALSGLDYASMETWGIARGGQESSGKMPVSSLAEMKIAGFLTALLLLPTTERTRLDRIAEKMDEHVQSGKQWTQLIDFLLENVPHISCEGAFLLPLATGRVLPQLERLLGLECGQADQALDEMMCKRMWG